MTSPRALLAAGLLVWRLADGRVTPDEGADTPRPVGSLQKAWVAKAWAFAHPDPTSPTPRLYCRPSSRCWLASGHGPLGLRGATAHSCNSYFRQLASEAPEGLLRGTLSSAGFDLPDVLGPEEAIGLTASVTISPRRLLEAYSDILTRPWAVRDDVRREWLDGMRDAGERGTAAGVPLRGLLTKTGTVPSLDGSPLRTSGWALLFDPSGRSGRLALLPDGTGSQAASALGGLLRAENPDGRAVKAPGRISTLLERGVSVRLLATLGATEILARNSGASPVEVLHAGASRWVGPGSEIAVLSGDRLGTGLWQLTLPRFGLVRLLRGSLTAQGGGARRDSDGGDARVFLVLHVTARDYVEGVLRGELPTGPPGRREELAAAVLRFLAQGRRHDGEDVCDLSHCATFVGFGPEVAWPSPRRAVILSPPSADPAAPTLDDAAWERIRAASRRPGPSFFTAHCGGEALSARAVWGAGDRDAAACPRHRGDGNVARWERTWADADLTALFGATVVSLSAIDRDGVRLTVVTTRSPSGPKERPLLFDELHALLASRLGWDALPSPPDGYSRSAGGWRVHGRGSGHRVGLCLAD